MEKSNFYRLQFVAIIFFILLVIIASAPAATYWVPGDYPTIQSAIDNCNNGDVVIVSPGIYTGNGNRDINFLGKAITITSADPNDPSIVAATVIDCNGSASEPHRGFIFCTGEESSSVLSGLSITNGWARSGGGIACSGSNPTINHCFVTGNSADSGGGGINCSNSSPQIFNCSITENSAINGGGFACYMGNPVISHCKIIDNSATYSAGGIRCGHFSNVFIDNCIITDNIAHSGGGIYVWQGSADIIHCTIANNSAERGGGIDCGASYSTATMSHCILWNNIANSGSQVMLRDSSEQSYFDISYSDVQGGHADVSVEPGWALNWDESNIDFDPLFVNAGEYDYHLSAHSFCIDSGDPAYIVLPDETDIDGDPRVLGIRTDMGADESTYVTETPVIGFSPVRFDLYSHADGPSPKEQTLFIRNTGINTLSWQIGEDCSWIELCPTNGQSVYEIDEVTVSINTTGFSVGSYFCELELIGEGAFNNPQVIPINVHVANRELHVPSEYPTIQAAIDAALADGQIVIVADGIYTGDGNRDIDFKGKSITVRSENGPENCIVDCEDDSSGFRFYSGEDQNSILDGFTITNADSSGISCRDSSPTISKCNISNCSASYGGGIDCRDDSCATIINCNIINNKAGHGSGISCEYGSDAMITNCVIVGNMSYEGGGGLRCTNDSSPKISNCTIIGNYSGLKGGGLYCRESNPTLTNCILWANTPDEIYMSKCTSDITYSNIDGNWPGEGNIYADPCFVREGFWDANGTPDDVRDDFWIDGDYHLFPESHCIDAGDPNYCAEPNETDLDGNPRIQGGRIDMGVYEHLYIESYMKITPVNFNPASKGKWVKAHFILPREYIIDDVDINKPAEIWPFGIKSDSVDAFINDESLVEIVASFERCEICSYVSGEQVLSLMCVVFGTNGEYFYGTDDVVIKNKHFEELSKFVLYWLNSDCKKPDWCDGLDFNMDGSVDFFDFAILANNCLVGTE